MMFESWDKQSPLSLHLLDTRTDNMDSWVSSPNKRRLYARKWEKQQNGTEVEACAFVAIGSIFSPVDEGQSMSGRGNTEWTLKFSFP
jgi:hypothetical protein